MLGIAFTHIDLKVVHIPTHTYTYLHIPTHPYTCSVIFIYHAMISFFSSLHHVHNIFINSWDGFPSAAIYK